MFAQKLLLPAFAVLSLAAAQSASICSQATATINSQTDATLLASCSTISGDVLVSPDAGGIISLDGPEQITGSLICHSAGGLTSLTSTTLGSIGKTFDLFNLTHLTTITMPDLQQVNSINWAALTALNVLTSLISTASNVTITDTFLSTLDGINLKTVATLNVNNNRRLNKFSAELTNVTSSLNLDSNGNSLAVSLPDLVWAANATFRNVSSLSIPALAVVNGSLGFYENSFTSVSAPNLTSIGNSGTLQGGLAFVANPLLANISLPLLTSVGGQDQIANNSALGNISFPSLNFVGGAIDFSGNFSTPSLPDLQNVKGGFNMQSMSSIDCSGFQSQHSSGVIQGVFTCKTTKDASSGLSSTGSSTGTATGSSASPTTSKKGSAASFRISEAAAGLALVGGLLHMLL